MSNLNPLPNNPLIQNNGGAEYGVARDTSKDWFVASTWRGAVTHIGAGLLATGVTVLSAYAYYRKYIDISDTEQQYIDGCDRRFATSPIQAYQEIIDDCKNTDGYENLGYAAKQGLDYMLQGAQLAYNAWFNRQGGNITSSV